MELLKIFRCVSFEKISWSHTSQKSHLVGDRMIARAFEFERARDRARSSVSAAPRVADASTAGVGVAADFRAVATVGASGGSRVGWSVTRVWCVHARATDAIRPTCEEACVRERVVMTFAWVCEQRRSAANQPASRVRVSGTWRAILDASSTTAAVAVVAVRRWGVNWCWSFRCCCSRLWFLPRTPTVKVSRTVNFSSCTLPACPVTCAGVVNFLSLITISVCRHLSCIHV